MLRRMTRLPRNTPRVSSAPFPWPPALHGTLTNSMRRCDSAHIVSRRRWLLPPKSSMTRYASWPPSSRICRRLAASSSMTSPPSAKFSKSSSPPAHKTPSPPRCGPPRIFCSSIPCKNSVDISPHFFRFRFLCELCARTSAPSALKRLTSSTRSAPRKKVREWRRMKTPLTGRALKTFQKQLLAWFRAHQRDLPWRRSRDAYRIWVAEVMLQQTRIAAVMPYYHRFLARFATVRSLALAHGAEVLKLWSGLGYYSRARNLHRAAKIIVAQHESKFPRTLDAALELPGIGTYTAAAVLSIAYDVPLAVLDGNVARVLARITAIHGDLRAPNNWRALMAAAQNLLATQAPSDWNQSLMELGEVICTPQSPRCAECPVASHCRAYAQGLTNKIPAPRRKRAP